MSEAPEEGRDTRNRLGKGGSVPGLLAPLVKYLPLTSSVDRPAGPDLPYGESPRAGGSPDRGGLAGAGYGVSEARAKRSNDKAAAALERTPGGVGR